MNPSNPAKFGIAFALGLIVALAGVTVYVKTSGVHIQGPPPTSETAVAQHAKQPETLNAPKVEEPLTVEPPAAPPGIQAAAVPPVPPVSAPPKKKLAIPEKVSAPQPTHVSRAHYPPRSFPESTSTIRVDVSQLRTPADGSSAQQPVPVTANQPIRTVDEDQALPAPPPATPVPVPPPAPQPHTVVLRSGTNVSIRLGETLSTEKNFSGDTFRATLDRPIILDGFIIADKGSKVLGKISALDKGGKFGGTSSLQLALTEINTTDGQRVRIQTQFVNRKGPASNGGEVAKVGGGAILGALIGGLAGGGKGAAIGAGAGGAVGAGTVMAGKGRPAVIASETPLTFQLSAPTTITEHLN